MMPFLTDFYGNPRRYTILAAGQAALERAHPAGAALLGAEYPSEIIFTSCATEATATAIASAIALLPERREIITSAVEHPATLAACEHLERQGYLIHRIAVDSEGALDMAQFRAALSPRVARRDVGE
jgi:cysteine desulfurase